MTLRHIEVSTDTFASLWRARLPNEYSEEDIIRRLLELGGNSMIMKDPIDIIPPSPLPSEEHSITSRPQSIRWTDLLVWALNRLGREAPLAEIYRVSREGRRSLGHSTTVHHDASARECLESHCSDSDKYRHKADLFWMPYGKGAGIWALR